MAISNHEALGQGLALYTHAMSQFVKQRLVGALPNTWWEDGVLKVLPDPKKRQLQNDMAKTPRDDRAEYIDPSILVQVITRHHAWFQDAFPNYRQTSSLLIHASEARNTWAHSLSSDLPSDEVGLALMAMERLLSDADLPAAGEVGVLRKKVMGIVETASDEPPEPAAVSAPITATKAGTGIPYWWDVCEPHDGFKNPAHVDESRFAASLGRVFAGNAAPEYLDPVSFLSQTYFTENLTQMVREIASRLSEGDGASVTEVQTPFGGGKTHALLTFFHLVNNPAAASTVPGAQEALGSFSIPAGARVLVFDGQEHGADPVLKENGVAVSTMWGELTSQVNAGLFNRLIADCDGKAEAPGNGVFGQVLEAASPCLILIDEVVSYLVKLRYSNSRRTQNLYRQTVQFLQEILQLAGNIPGVCVLLSLPQSRVEFGGIDPQQLQRDLQILEELQPRADRVVSKRTPVNDEEIYLLMSRRLFRQTDPDAAERVARGYRDIYERTPGQYDGTVRSADYLKHQVDAYPFHPELIDVLYKKWSTASDFPRTRAVCGCSCWLTSWPTNGPTGGNLTRFNLVMWTSDGNALRPASLAPRAAGEGSTAWWLRTLSGEMPTPTTRTNSGAPSTPVIKSPGEWQLPCWRILSAGRFTREPRPKSFDWGPFRPTSAQNTLPRSWAAWNSLYGTSTGKGSCSSSRPGPTFTE